MHEGDGPQTPPTGLYGWYVRIMTAIGASAMGALVVVMVVQVIARYVFNASLIWAEELCRYILIWITFLFIGLAYQRGELVTVDIVTMALRPVWRYALKVAVTIPVLVFVWLMTTNGYDYANRFGAQKIPALDFIWMSLTGGRTADVSIQWVYHSVTVGSGLLLLHILVSLVSEGWQLFRHGRDASAGGRGA